MLRWFQRGFVLTGLATVATVWWLAGDLGRLEASGARARGVVLVTHRQRPDGQPGRPVKARVRFVTARGDTIEMTGDRAPSGFTVGDTVDVLYDAARPALRSVLVPELGAKPLLMVVIGGGLSSLFIVLGLWVIPLFEGRSRA